MPLINCTLHGSLEDVLDANRANNQRQLDFDHLPSIEEILLRLSVKREYLHYVMVDGHYVELEDWGKPIHGLSIQLWPRIAGG